MLAAIFPELVEALAFPVYMSVAGQLFDILWVFGAI